MSPLKSHRANAAIIWFHNDTKYNNIEELRATSKEAIRKFSLLAIGYASEIRMYREGPGDISSRALNWWGIVEVASLTIFNSICDHMSKSGGGIVKFSNALESL